MNIYQRINEVRKAVGYLKKDAKVKGGQSYTAMSHDKVTAAARGHLIEHGILVIPTQTDATFIDTGRKTKSGTPFIRVDCWFSFDFVNIDEPTDRFTTTIFSCAEDTTDKGPGKAISYAKKMVMLKVLEIESGDNEEKRPEESDNFINDEQQKEITDTMEDVGADKDKFLGYLQVDSVETIPASKYSLAIKALEVKKNANN